jgi:type IV pilus assembly protein PilA
MSARAAQLDERGMTRNTRKPRKTPGFSLIELLIVVSVILIIAAIAIPNFMRSKMRANETSAVSSLRSVTTAEVVYSTIYGIGYSPTLAALGGTNVIVDQTSAGLIDSVLSSGAKSGYKFTYAAPSSDANGNILTYTVNADPAIVGTSGDIHYYVDQTSILRENPSAVAGLNDTPVN